MFTLIASQISQSVLKVLCLKLLPKFSSVQNETCYGWRGALGYRSDSELVDTCQSRVLSPIKGSGCFIEQKQNLLHIVPVKM